MATLNEILQQYVNADYETLVAVAQKALVNLMPVCKQIDPDNEGVLMASSIILAAIGADGVLIAEPLAGLLSPGLAEEFSSEYMNKIVEACQTDEFLIGYHNCGNATIQQINSIKTNGCRILHFGNAIQMADMVPLVPENILVMGNVDPAGVLRNGTPESVKAETKRIMEACAKYPNFIISSGCDIPPMSPWENIDAFFEAVDEYYAAN